MDSGFGGENGFEAIDTDFPALKCRNRKAQQSCGKDEPFCKQQQRHKVPDGQRIIADRPDTQRQQCQLTYTCQSSQQGKQGVLRFGEP